MKKKENIALIIIVIILVLLILTLIGLVVFRMSKVQNSVGNSGNNNINDIYVNDIKTTKNTSAEFFAVQTHSGFNDTIKSNQYKITTKEELEKFFELYEGFELSKEYDLSNNTIFIQTQVEGSGSIDVKFDGVNINKKVEFDINIVAPEIGTADMAYWYLVAIIPNNELNGVDVSDWKSPIEINNSLKNEYTITVEIMDLTLRESLSIVEEHVKEVGNIRIQKFSFSPLNYKKTYTLISYDENSVNQLIQNINNQETEARAKVASTETKDNSEFESFKESLNQTITPYYQIDLWSSTINNYTSWRNYS